MAAWIFFKEWGKQWWLSMSCAAFTLLGIYIAATSRANDWTVRVSLSLALLFFVVASYRAWKRQYDKYNAELRKNSQPEIHGEYFHPVVIHMESGRTQYLFSLSLCNHRPQPTTLKHVILTLSDDSDLRLQPHQLTMDLNPPGHMIRLEQGIEAIVECSAAVGTPDAIFRNKSAVRVVDAFGNSYDIARRPDPSDSTSDPLSPLPSQA